MSRVSWPGADLASANATTRAAARQAFAMALVAGVAAGVVVAPIHEPEPITSVVVVLASLGTLVASAVGLIEHDRALRHADRLIEQGFRCDGRVDATSRFVARRIAYLESYKHRVALARLCQQDLDLSQTRDDPVGYPQPYVSTTTLRQNADVLRRIIANLEDGPCDPCAALLLERTLRYNSPTPFCGTYESWRQAQEQYSVRLHRVLSMIDRSEAEARDSSAERVRS